MSWASKIGSVFPGDNEELEQLGGGNKLTSLICRKSNGRWPARRISFVPSLLGEDQLKQAEVSGEALIHCR